MPFNLRSKSITGHVTDSAGNIVRNSRITIKSITPLEDIQVDSVTTNDDGYFVSSPLPNGRYSVYDSGVLISTVLHDPDAVSIECFKSERPAPATYESLKLTPNSYYSFIQIEPRYLNIGKYGNLYPIYIRDISTNVAASKINITSDDRITTTRFDVEFYESSSGRRVRFSGVPAVRYSTNGRLVIPISYSSIVANNPREIGMANSVEYTSLDKTVTFSTTTAVMPGDIIKIHKAAEVYYGIVTVSSGVNSAVMWDKMLSESTVITNGSGFTLDVFDGLNTYFDETGNDANMNFTVVENIQAQNAMEDEYTK